MSAGRDVMPFSKRTYEKGLLSTLCGLYSPQLNVRFSIPTIMTIGQNVKWLDLGGGLPVNRRKSIDT